MYIWSILSFLITSAYNGNVRALLIVKTRGPQIKTFEDIARTGYEWTTVEGNLPGAALHFPQSSEMQATLRDTVHFINQSSHHYENVKS